MANNRRSDPLLRMLAPDGRGAGAVRIRVAPRRDVTMLAVFGVILLLALYTIEKRRTKRTTNVDGFVIEDGHPIARKGVRDHDQAPFFDYPLQ